MACRAVKAEGIDPKRIIDIGSGTGISAEVAKNEFPDALIETLDPSVKGSSANGRPDNIFDHFYCRLADMGIDDEFDLLLSNMSYHWLEDDDKKVLNSIATRNGVLAITVPIRRISEAFQDCGARGNEILMEVYREVMEARDVSVTPRNWRGIDVFKEEIDGFQVLSRDEVEISEIVSGADFGDVLHSRGVMLALFGPKAEAAYRSLKQRALSGDVEISWPIGIVIARRDQL